MNLTQSHLIAACRAFLDPDGSHELLLIPAGSFQAIDGRPGTLKGGRIDAWVMNAAAAEKVVAAFNATARHLVIDYEHQTVHAERNGQPAPAAGWIEALMWREGKGLMARVTWTDRATAMIRSGEYKYISPTFSFDPKSGRVTQLHHAGLTNNPALPGLGEVAARMGRIHPDSKEKPLSTQKIAQALGLEPDADETAILNAIQAKTEVKTTAPVPDPATHVPLEAVKEMQAEIAALKSKVVQAEVDAVVTQSLANGRLPKGLESWARSLGASNMVALNAFLDQAQPIAALTAMQTGGKGPEATSQPTLDAAELTVCTALGVDSKDFVATKASLKGEG